MAGTTMASDTEATRRPIDGSRADRPGAAWSAAASPVLVDFARNGTTSQMKGRALFWLAQRAVEEALPTISNAIDSDPDTEVKKQAVFALSQLPKDEGVPRLIDLARTHRNPDVRRQAFYWLGQSSYQRLLSLAILRGSSSRSARLCRDHTRGVFLRGLRVLRG